MLRKWTSKDPKTEFGQLLPKALRTIGSVILGQAMQFASGNVRTGRLRGSLTFALQDQQSKPQSPAGGKDIIGKPSVNDEVWIGTNVEYGPYVEYGTRRSKAYPYLRPAFDMNRKNAIKILRDAIEADYGK